MYGRRAVLLIDIEMDGFSHEIIDKEEVLENDMHGHFN